MAPPDPEQYVLTDEERTGAKETVGKWLRYLENRKKSGATSDEMPLYTRRRNLSVHLGVDEAVNKKDLQLINVCALPLPYEQKLERSQSLRERRASETFLREILSEDVRYLSSEVNLLEATEETPKLTLRSPSTDQECGLKYSETLNTILEDEDSISISSAVSSSCKSTCRNYTCCEKESCNEEVVVLDQCPKESHSERPSSPTADIPTMSFSKIILKCPHCHLDCLTILPDGKDSLTLARIETCGQNSSVRYSCCDDELCREETVCLDRCPNDQNSNHSEDEYHDREEREYKIKDLPNYLGMKEVVPTSIDTTEKKILRKLSSSLKIKKHREHKNSM